MHIQIYLRNLKKKSHWKNSLPQEYNIKMDLKELGCESVNRLHVAQTVQTNTNHLVYRSFRAMWL
jgi:hypothetical protein